MKKPLFSVFNYLILLMLTFTTLSAESVRLAGHVPVQALENATLVKKLEAETPVSLSLLLPLRNVDKLEQLILRLYDKNDELYGKYLTSEEFVDQFGPTVEDYQNVIAFAENLGLTVDNTHQNRTILNVSGKSERIEEAFNLNLHQYATPNGRLFHAPNNDPEVPSEIASLIHGIIGLDNHAVWHTYSRKKEAAEHFISSNDQAKASPSGPNGGYAPHDIITAYELNAIPTNGSNQNIALFELAGYQVSDITAYTTHFGLPAPKLTNVLVDGGSGSNTPNPEVTLDIELALAIAPESQIYVYEGPNSNQGVLDTYNRIATDNIAKQVSTSWGLGENLVSSQYSQAENAIFMQMAAHGQTIYAAAGDSGAYDDYAGNGSRALVVDDPASQPYVTGVGGTRLTVNSANGAYESESVWNDGLGNGAGGGGVSTVWTIPSWQTNVPGIKSTTHRNVPDVALNADTNSGYAIYFDGSWTVYGGTSCAAPLWAAFTSLVNEELINNQKPVLGFINPLLYSIGTGAAYSSNFHDITTGNNLYYKAGVGYDNATGLGSFNGANLFTSLTHSTSQGSPVLNIVMKHSDPFIKGGIGTYVIHVSNSGNAQTAGAPTVTITLPQGITYHSLTGSGWSFNTNTLTCKANMPLAPGASYSPIVLKVNVARHAPSSFTPTAGVSGGGSVSNTSSNFTTAK